MKTNMEDFIDEALGGRKRRKPTIGELREQGVGDKPPSDTETDGPEKSKKEKESDVEKLDLAAKKKDDISKKKASEREPKGQKVLEASLSIDSVDQGRIEVGADEYGTITDMSSLLDLFDIDTTKMMDPQQSVKSFVLSIQEVVSQTGKNSISMMMQANKDNTVSINVLVNEIGQAFTDIKLAVQYFNTQYQRTILDVINKALRG